MTEPQSDWQADEVGLTVGCKQQPVAMLTAGLTVLTAPPRDSQCKARASLEPKNSFSPMQDWSGSPLTAADGITSQPEPLWSDQAPEAGAREPRSEPCILPGCQEEGLTGPPVHRPLAPQSVGLPSLPCSSHRIPGSLFHLAVLSTCHLFTADHLGLAARRWSTPALELLWEKCCSDNVVVRAACCDTLVVLVAQDHADHQYVLNNILNLIPSARNPPHPYISVLENRPDCWPALLQQIAAVIQQCREKSEVACVSMLAPFLRYLYCETSHLPEHAKLRQSLLKALLPSCETMEEREEPSAADQQVLQLLFDLVPHLQDFPSSQVIVGLSLLLLQAPASQQTPILNLALKIIAPSETQQLPVAAPILVMPLLQIISSAAVMEVLSDSQISTSNQQLALTLLHTVQEQDEGRKEDPLQLSFPISGWYSNIFITWNTLDRLSQDRTAAYDWLHSVQSTLPYNERVPEHVTLLVAYFIARKHRECFEIALKTAAELARVDASQVPSLVPVLMFKLGKLSDPVLSHAVLYTLPALGTHKILRALQMLGSTPKLRAVVLRLMTSLWEMQDRVYPELQRFIGMLDKPSMSIGKEDQWEQILAKAASIRDICKQRPYQHGGDMLAAISQVLNQCTKPDQATPSALVLQGLHELCRAEVVDIRSTWNALSPKLSCDSRPLVVKALTELFSLIPVLAVKTEEYEKFKVQVVGILWSYAQSKNPVVASSGYKALSEFSAEEHIILHLPEQARPEVKKPESDEEMNEEEEEEKEEDLSVPGTSYIKLLTLTPPAVFSALQDFLASLMKQEMVAMPRGVYHSALKGGALRTGQGKAVAGIPGFMLKTYEKNRQPGLKPGLAAGLLLCYDLPIQTDRDGRPINRFLVSRGRSYQQMLTALIHEVNIQPSEWHRSVLLPQGWRGFMGRAYHALLQGRQAELEMQQRHGKESPEDIQYKQFTAWLWVRDQLTDAVKSAAKDSPVMQGNSILALTGLAVAVAKYENSLPSDVESTQEIGAEVLATKHWLVMVLDTLLSIVDSCYHPKGRVFPWFQHKSYSGENTASAIARSCAALALSLMVPLLITSHKESIEEILNKLTAGLPGKPHADESQAVQFHTGLALGMFLSCLYEERVSTGCILGVGLVLSLMSHSSQTESRVHVAVTLDKLLDSLDESSNQGRMLQEVLAYSVACVSVSAFSVGIIEANKAEEVMKKLRAMTEQSQQTPGFALALGITVHGLSACGHGKAEDFYARVLPAWIKILLTEGCPTMQRLAAVNGLVALVGSESSLIQLKSDAVQASQHQSRLNEVIRTITQVISFSGAIGLQSNASCLIGHVHLANLSSSQSRTSVPPDLGYLSEKSVIKAAVDYIIEAGKKGPESIPPELVKVALEPVASVGGSFQYPPVNWAAILSPLMRLNFGEDIQQHCIELAVSQAQSSQSASMFLGMWLAPPLVYSLSLKTRGYLYKSLSLWMKHVPDDKLQSYVEALAVQHFTAENRLQYPGLCLSVLEGLGQATKLPNPAQYCWGIICNTTEKIFQLLPDEIQDSEVSLYVEIAKCLSEMADTEIDRITQVTKDNLVKTSLIRAYLVSQGRVPLLCLNDVIAAALGDSQKESVCWMLLQSFYQARLAANPNTGVLNRMEWLLELMGHIRNVAYRSTPVEHEDIKQATDFLLQIFSAAVVSWADHTSPLLLGVSAKWLLRKQETACTNTPKAIFGKHSADALSVQHCLTVLPYSIQLLLAKEPWKGQTQKVQDELDFLERLDCRAVEGVKVLSVFGNTGDGKSHTLNHCLFGGEEVFPTSPLQDSCTVGVWAAFEPALGLVALDTEGLLGASGNQNQRMRLLLKVLAVSDVVVYRTRAERLHNDMFQFLGSASSAYLRHFTRELRALSSRCGLEVPLSSLGPAIIVFQETSRTRLLGWGKCPFSVNLS
ncbi:Focadhesin [Acipenser ruthenus]|uniref:Focadhesin n=1 Tax=Acipenser ruthenus TaxID=7906 RepID=A0A444TWZ6_ACIRT|nr:Focadhesin [Acipenser ruthenus]